MPVLDWLRTDIAFELPDRSKALYFHRTAFVAFDLFMLERPNAIADYSAVEIAQAKTYFERLLPDQKQYLFSNCLLGLPGSDIPFTKNDVLDALTRYQHIDSQKLKQHLAFFLQQVVPVAEEAGIKMAIHPDDPPYPLLGLPRIVSTHADLANVLAAAPSPANGLCFCTGSLGARADNDIPSMIEQFGDFIHFVHLRNTKRDDQGNFFEADHLAGDTDMYAVVKALHDIMQKRQVELPMRPDHGHQMLDDLNKKTYPGYSAIGRLKGLAELRGLEWGICHSRQV
jgi:mannonate dehydratase